MSDTTISNASFLSFVSELMRGDMTHQVAEEMSHAERIEAMSQEGRVVAIDVETWWWYLDVLPPRWMQGDAFVFAEGYDRFRLFWRRGDEHFVRQLSEGETDRFCKLSGARRYD